MKREIVTFMSRGGPWWTVRIKFTLYRIKHITLEFDVSDPSVVVAYLNAAKTVDVGPIRDAIRGGYICHKRFSEVIHLAAFMESDDPSLSPVISAISQALSASGKDHSFDHTERLVISSDFRYEEFF